MPRTPSAIAFSTYCPERMPPSSQTSIPPTDSVDDRGQRRDRRWGTIDLPAAMIRYDQRIGSTRQRASHPPGPEPLRISFPPQRFYNKSTPHRPMSRWGRTAGPSKRPERSCSRPPVHGQQCCRIDAASCQACPCTNEACGKVNQICQRELGRRRKTVLDVLVPLDAYWQVERQDERSASCGLCSIDESTDEISISKHVQPEPERLVRMRRHFFDRANTHRTQRIRNSESLASASGSNLAICMLHAGQAGGRDCDRQATSTPIIVVRGTAAKL